MFVALEGADGCGKTTLCSILAERLGAVAYSTPPKKYLQMREGVDKNSPAEEHYRFYRDGIYDASDEIDHMLKDGKDIVSDRYWLTTLTYHQVMGVAVSVNDFSSVVQPTMTVILALNHEIQIERMLHRGMSVGDRRMLDKQREIASMFYKNILELNVPFAVLDTQYLSPSKCADVIVAMISK